MVRAQQDGRAGRRVELDPAAVAQKEIAASAKLEEVRAAAADETAVAIARPDGVAAILCAGVARENAGCQIDRPAIGQDRVVARADGQVVRAAAEDAEIGAVARADRVGAVEGRRRGGQSQRVEFGGALFLAFAGLECHRSAIAKQKVAARAERDVVRAAAARDLADAVAGDDGVVPAGRRGACGEGQGDEIDRTVVADDDIVARADRGAVRAVAEDDDAVSVARRDGVVSILCAAFRHGLQHEVVEAGDGFLRCVKFGLLVFVGLFAFGDEGFELLQRLQDQRVEGDRSVVANHRVAAFAERDVVRAAAADDHVDRVESARRVFAAIRQVDIVPARQRGGDGGEFAVAAPLDDAGPGRAFEPRIVACDDVGAAGGGERVVALAAEDQVGAVAAGDAVIVARCVRDGGYGLHPFQNAGAFDIGAVADQDVGAAGVGQNLHLRARAAAADQNVGADAARQRVDAGGGVADPGGDQPLHDAVGGNLNRGEVADEDRGARAAGQHIAVAAADQNISAAVSEDLIRAVGLDNRLNYQRFRKAID